MIRKLLMGFLFVRLVVATPFVFIGYCLISGPSDGVAFVRGMYMGFFDPVYADECRERIERKVDAA